MSPSVTSTTSTSGTGDQSTAGLIKNKTADKDMFLKLLVAQLRNQDPLKPSGGTEFIAQLAQFQQLEQSMNTGQDISAMRKVMDQYTAGTTPTTESNS